MSEQKRCQWLDCREEAESGIWCERHAAPLEVSELPGWLRRLADGVAIAVAVEVLKMVANEIPGALSFYGNTMTQDSVKALTKPMRGIFSRDSGPPPTKAEVAGWAEELSWVVESFPYMAESAMTALRADY